MDYDSMPKCERLGKAMHPSRKSAQKHLKQLERLNRDPSRVRYRKTKQDMTKHGRIMVFECKHCDHWHVGRQSRRERRHELAI